MSITTIFQIIQNIMYFIRSWPKDEKHDIGILRIITKKVEVYITRKFLTNIYKIIIKHFCGICNSLIPVNRIRLYIREKMFIRKIFYAWLILSLKV